MVPECRKALEEAWCFASPQHRKEILDRMRSFDDYRRACADFLEAAYDVESNLIESPRKVVGIPK